MRITLFMLSIFLILSVSAQKKVKSKVSKEQKKKTEKLLTVSGTVKQTSAYCGGARPNEEMLRELSTPKPYVGKRFIVKKGVFNETKEKTLLTFTTNEQGEFSFQLPAGTYCILVESQEKPLNMEDYNKQEYLRVEEECLKKWWRMPYHRLEITEKDVKGLDFNFHHRCFVPEDIPCINYQGPMPP